MENLLRLKHKILKLLLHVEKMAVFAEREFTSK